MGKAKLALRLSKRKSPAKAHLRVKSHAATVGLIDFRGLLLSVALGRSGIRAVKREGDSATPLGLWPVEYVLFRADRLRKPVTAIPAMPIKPGDGWCDAPGDRNYNRKVPIPYAASAERLWRDDGLYDIVAVLNHNRCPRIMGGGSAIFLHIAQRNFAPTAGCIAIKREHLLRFLAAMPSRFAIGVAAKAHPISAGDADSDKDRLPVFRAQVSKRHLRPHRSRVRYAAAPPR